MNLNFDNFPELVTDRLVLREVGISDKNEIFELRSNPVILKYLDRDPVKSVEEAVEFIEMNSESRKNNGGLWWGITMKNQPKLIGTIGFWRIDVTNHRAEIGYALYPDFQGKGIMSEAMEAVLDHGFRVVKFHSVEANVNPANKASIHLLERHGFVKEAHFKENYYYNGVFLDSAIYSLISKY